MTFDYACSRKVIIRFDKEVEYGNEIESHFEQIPIENGVKTKHEIRMQEQLYCEANIIWKINKKEVVTEGATSRNKKKFIKLFLKFL